MTVSPVSGCICIDVMLLALAVISNQANAPCQRNNIGRGHLIEYLQCAGLQACKICRRILRWTTQINSLWMFAEMRWFRSAWKKWCNFCQLLSVVCQWWENHQRNYCQQLRTIFGQMWRYFLASRAKWIHEPAAVLPTSLCTLFRSIKTPNNIVVGFHGEKSRTIISAAPEAE